MIVLDEHLKSPSMVDAIRHWYRGRVCIVTELRRGTIIKDSAIPGLLSRVHQPTFVTLNTPHFWKTAEPNAHYCIVCLDGLANERVVPLLLRRLFAVKEFRSRASRMGKMIRMTRTLIQYYSNTDRSVREIAWS